MFVKISPQHRPQRGPRSVKSFITYLEKENDEKSPEQKELFFNQHNDQIPSAAVIDGIESNMSTSLPKTAPKYYIMTISPSQYELAHISNDSAAIKTYTREVMKDYASSFQQEINGRPVKVDDIKYYAKIEHQRFFTSRDSAVRENAPFLKQINILNNKIQRIRKRELDGNIKTLKEDIESLQTKAPHIIDNQLVKPGIKKEGLQTHVHLILSRRDATNSVGLSPGVGHRNTNTILNGKSIKYGFDRNLFIRKTERTFHRLFNYNRNFVESYEARKTFKRNPRKYYTQLSALPLKEKRVAFILLKQASAALPALNLSPNQINLVIQQIKKAVEVGVRSSSIGY